MRLIKAGVIGLPEGDLDPEEQQLNVGSTSIRRSDRSTVNDNEHDDD